MSYLYWYFGIGVTVLLVVFISHRLSLEKNEFSIQAILKSIHPERETWHYKLRDKVLAPMIAAILLPMVWPLIAYWKAKELISQSRVEEELEEKEFKVSKSDLILHMSVTEIETLEKVIDPLGAVPDFPFGHLNAVWEKFKISLRSNDEIWTFTARWEQTWSNQELYGYAILRDSGVPDFFVTDWIEIKSPPVPPNFKFSSRDLD